MRQTIINQRINRRTYNQKAKHSSHYLSAFSASTLYNSKTNLYFNNGRKSVILKQTKIHFNNHRQIHPTIKTNIIIYSPKKKLISTFNTPSVLIINFYYTKSHFMGCIRKFSSSFRLLFSFLRVPWLYISFWNIYLTLMVSLRPTCYLLYLLASKTQHNIFHPPHRLFPFKNTNRWYYLLPVYCTRHHLHVQ